MARSVQDVMRRGLRAGEKFLMPDGAEWEVVHLTWAGAYVRPVARERRSFETVEGVTVDFDAPGRSVVIATHSAVEVL